MYILPAMWLSLWTSMISVGVMAGALATGYVCDHFGSRIAVLLGCLVSIAGAMVCTFSDHSGGLELRRVVFLIGKMVLGLGLGFVLPASQTYISEVSPMRVRGPLLSSFTMFVVRAEKLKHCCIRFLSTAGHRPGHCRRQRLHPNRHPRRHLVRGKSHPSCSPLQTVSWD
jgi:hypothetical protein